MSSYNYYMLMIFCHVDLDHSDKTLPSGARGQWKTYLTCPVISLSLSLSLSLSFSLPLSLSLSIYLSIYLSVSLSIYLSISLSISLYLSIYLCIYQSNSLTLFLFLYIYLYQSLFFYPIISFLLSSIFAHLTLSQSFSSSVFLFQCTSPYFSIYLFASH